MDQIASGTLIKVNPFNPEKRKAEVRAKIKKIVKVALIAILSIAMTLTQPPILITGIIAGIIFSKKIEKMFDRIGELWKKHHFKLIGVGVLCTIVAAPVVFIATAALTGSYLGMRLVKT